MDQGTCISFSKRYIFTIPFYITVYRTPLLPTRSLLAWRPWSFRSWVPSGSRPDRAPAGVTGLRLELVRFFCLSVFNSWTLKTFHELKLFWFQQVKSCKVLHIFLRLYEVCAKALKKRLCLACSTCNVCQLSPCPQTFGNFRVFFLKTCIYSGDPGGANIYMGLNVAI